MCDSGGALNTLVVKCEADDHGVGHLHRADARGVADSSATVNQDVIVSLAHLPLHLLEKRAATVASIKIIPVKQIDQVGISGVLFACGKKVQPPAVEIPVERYGVALYVGITLVPIVI